MSTVPNPIGSSQTHRSPGIGLSEEATQGFEELRDLSQAVDCLSQGCQPDESALGAIQEIAVQSNLLALNAAIRAVREDEDGARFETLAEEAIALARRTAEAASQTTRLIGPEVSGAARRRVAAGAQGVLSQVEEVSAIVGRLRSKTRS